MLPFAKSILIFTALLLAHSAAGADAAKGQGVAAAMAVFVDSFGLNIAQKSPQAKQTTTPPANGAPVLPAADSFGLNSVQSSVVSDCLVTKGEARAFQNARRCIEI